MSLNFLLLCLSNDQSWGHLFSSKAVLLRVASALFNGVDSSHWFPDNTRQRGGVRKAECLTNTLPPFPVFLKKNHLAPTIPKHPLSSETHVFCPVRMSVQHRPANPCFQSTPQSRLSNVKIGRSRDLKAPGSGKLTIYYGMESGFSLVNQVNTPYNAHTWGTLGRQRVWTSAPTYSYECGIREVQWSQPRSGRLSSRRPFCRACRLPECKILIRGREREKGRGTCTLANCRYGVQAYYVSPPSPHNTNRGLDVVSDNSRDLRNKRKNNHKKGIIGWEGFFHWLSRGNKNIELTIVYKKGQNLGKIFYCT